MTFQGLAPERVLILSSRGSAYGAQVLRAARAAGLNVVGVIIEDAYARGGWHRIKRSVRRYGWLAVLFRGFEVCCSRTVARLAARRRAETVEEAASECGVSCLMVASLNGKEARRAISAYRPDLALLGGTGILDGKTLSLFPLGVLNAHPGLLPQYQGNYGNRWAVLNGDQCGITVYRLSPVLDEGPVLVREIVERGRREWPERLDVRVTTLCSQIVVRAALEYMSGRLQPREQVPSEGKCYGLLPVRQALRLYCRIWREKPKGHYRPSA